MSVGHPGEPGKPGEPGEPGTRGGGAGGRGGRGGRGGAAAREEHRWQWVVAFCVIIAVGLSVATLLLVQKVDSNSQKIVRLEEQHTREAKGLIAALAQVNRDQDVAIGLIRQTDYRLCFRQQILRAAINLDANHDEPILQVEASGLFDDLGNARRFGKT